MNPLIRWTLSALGALVLSVSLTAAPVLAEPLTEIRGQYSLPGSFVVASDTLRDIQFYDGAVQSTMPQSGLMGLMVNNLLASTVAPFSSVFLSDNSGIKEGPYLIILAQPTNVIFQFAGAGDLLNYTE